jgi:hypothetical protein
MSNFSLRRGWFVLLPLFLISVISSLSPVKAADGNKLVFAYQEAVVYQEVNVPNDWASASSLTATVSAAEAQDWKASSDTLAVAINLYGQGGGRDILPQHWIPDSYGWWNI